MKAVQYIKNYRRACRAIRIVSRIKYEEQSQIKSRVKDAITSLVSLKDINRQIYKCITKK